jgi:hypothetical protein
LGNQNINAYPRSQLDANVVNCKIYLIDGRTGGQDEFHDLMNLDLTQINDPETDTRSFGTPIPNVVWQAGCRGNKWRNGS